VKTKTSLKAGKASWGPWASSCSTPVRRPLALSGYPSRWHDSD